MISAIRDLSAIEVYDIAARGTISSPPTWSGNSPFRAARHVGGAGRQRESDILVTATTSREPVVRGAWLPAGATVLTVGSYEPDRRELDHDAMLRADLIAADDPVKADSYCGILVEARAARRAGAGRVDRRDHRGPRRAPCGRRSRDVPVHRAGRAGRRPGVGRGRAEPSARQLGRNVAF